MNGSFNRQILVDKLAKLNNSQQSIETLSHWCIFHRNNAKQVVEIWERQFQCSPREQRISFLYLANDILQNSRRKGLEFINEFWKVLPDALIDVFGNGDDCGRKTVRRLVGIWEERKVFGSRGQILKEEILGKELNNINKNVKPTNHNPKQFSGVLLEKIISSYDQIQDEDALFGKCQSAIGIIDKVEKDLENDNKLGNINRAEVMGELQIQHSILGDCTEQLKAAELSRATLISNLREALNEQETKLEQVHQQLLAAESRYKQAGDISAQLNDEHPPVAQKPGETSSTFSVAPPAYVPEAPASGPPAYVPEAPASSTGEARLTIAASSEENPLTDDKPQTKEENRKTAAAAMAAKLTESASSAQMLSFVLSTLASEGVIGQANKEDCPDKKKPKLQVDAPLQVPLPPPMLQFPMPIFSHPESILQLPPLQPLQPPSPATTLPNPTLEPPMMPPLTSAPPATLSAPAATPLMQSAAGTMTGVPYSYGLVPPPIPQYPMFGMPPNPSAPNPFYGFQAPDGANLIVQPPASLPSGPPPLTRQ